MEVIHRSDSYPLQSPRRTTLEESHPLPRSQHQQSTIHQSSTALEDSGSPAIEEHAIMSNRLASRSPSIGSWTEQTRHTPSASPPPALRSVPQNRSQIDGQSHDRMETDDEGSENTPSGSETPGPSNNHSNSSLPAEESPDGTEPMDTSLDGPNLVPQETGFPTSANDLQMLMDEQVAMAMGNEDLIRITSEGDMDNMGGISSTEQEAALHAILDRSPNPDAASVPTLGDPATATQTAGGLTDPPNGETASQLGNQAVPSDDASQGTAHIQQNEVAQEGQTAQETGGNQEAAVTQETHTGQTDNSRTDLSTLPDSPANKDDDEDTSDEEEHPYWAHYKQDTSSPDEDELKVMEEWQEPDALDHEHWEKRIFEPLEDPEFAPDETGRIEWTVKGVHGTPEKPNRESIMLSPSVLIGGYYWHIKYFPRGNERTDMMSLYIECSDTPHEDTWNDSKDQDAARDTEPSSETSPPTGLDPPAPTATDASTQSPNPPKKTDSKDSEASSAQDTNPWEVPAQIGCVVYNPAETSVYVQRRSCHRFHHETEDWGWTRFTGPWSEMHQRKHCEKKPLLQDDTLSFTAYIRTFKDHTGSLWWHPPNDREWNSHERFGLRSLQSDILSPPALPAAISALSSLNPFIVPLRGALNLGSDKLMSCRPREVMAAAHQIASGMVNTDTEGSDIPIGHLAEVLRWHCPDIGKMDVVELWENLRSLISIEAAGLPPGSDAPDIFSNLAIIRQPDRIASSKDHKSESTKGQPSIREPSSVQQTLDSTLSPKFLSGHLPSVIMVELHRQEYLQNSRRWRKLTHRISLDDKVELCVQKKADDGKHMYNLFGMVVHSGGLESNHYSTIIQPRGPGTRWIKYGSMFDEKKAECLTKKQVFEKYEGKDGADENTAVAYIALYARSDLLTEVFVKSAPQSSVSPEDVATDSKGGETKSHELEIIKEKDEPITMTVYDSEMFSGYSGRGILDPWSSQIDGGEATDNKLFPMEITAAKGMEDTDERVFEALKAKHPEEEHKFSLFGLDYDPKYFLRGPTPFLSYHSMKALKNPASKLHGCRLWLHKLNSEEKIIVEESRSQRKRQKISHEMSKVSSGQSTNNRVTEGASSNLPSTESSGEGAERSSPTIQGEGAHPDVEITVAAGTSDQGTDAEPDAMDDVSNPPQETRNEEAIGTFAAEAIMEANAALTDAAEILASMHTMTESSAPASYPEGVAAVEELHQAASTDQLTAAPTGSTDTTVTAHESTNPINEDAEATATSQPTNQSSQQDTVPSRAVVDGVTPTNADGASSEAVTTTAVVLEDIDGQQPTVPVNETEEANNAERPQEAALGGDIVMGGTQEASESSASEHTVEAEPKDGPECSEDLQEYTYILVKRFNPYEQSMKGISSFYCRKSDEIISIIRQKLLMDKDAKAFDVYQERTLLPTTEDRITDSQTFNDLSDRSQGRIFVIQDRLTNEETSSLIQSGLPPTIPLYFSTLLALENPAHRTPHYTRHYFSSPYLSTPQSRSLPHGYPATSISLTGDHYTGPFTLGTKSGPNGTLISASSGDTYSGGFENDLPHGQGTMHYARTGNIYEGGWRRGKWFGKGTMKFERAEAEARECAICWEEEMTTAVMPCGHLVACEGCARQVEQCPVCRRGVSGVLRVWVN